MNIENLALINSSILVLLIFTFSFIVDKYFSTKQAFKFGAVAMLFSAIPLFALLGSEQFVFCKHVAVLGISALICRYIGQYSSRTFSCIGVQAKLTIADSEY